MTLLIQTTSNTLRQVWRMIARVALLCAIAFGVPSFAQQAEPAPQTVEQISEIPENTATPIVWRMRDEDSDIWFIGTYHLLPPTLDWRSAPVKRAITKADEVYFEADLESPVAMSATLGMMIIRGFLPRGNTLSSMLSKEETQRLREICEELDLSFKAIDVMRPWNASITLSASLIVSQGFDPEAGLDSVLALEITASGRPIRYFETGAEQIGFFADLSEETQLRLLRSTINDWDNAATQSALLFEAWRTGDADEMDRQINGEFRDINPEIFDILLVNRNEAWVSVLEEVMSESGTTLVAVGAGHLVGDQSVISMLQAKGYKIERVIE